MVAFSRAAAAVCCSLGAVVALQPIARVRSAARAHAMRPLGSAVENPVAAEDAGPVEVEVVTAVAPAPAAAAAKIPLEEIVDGNWYEGTVTGLTAYGAFVAIGADADGLVHISQLSGGYTSDVASVVSVGDAVKVKVLSRDLTKKQLALSMKEEGAAAAPRAAKGGQRSKKAGAAELAEYQTADPSVFITGTVRSVLPWGAFVKIAEGVDGLVHISRVSDEHVEVLEDVLTAGQEVQVRIIDVDLEKLTVALAMNTYREGGGGGERRAPRAKRASSEDLMKYQTADPKEYVTGTVRTVLPWGAFVNIAEGVDGLVHVSRVSDERVEDLEQTLSVGQEVQVRITDVDLDKGTLGLAMNTYREGEMASRGGGAGGEGGEMSSRARRAYAPGGGDNKPNFKRPQKRDPGDDIWDNKDNFDWKTAMADAKNNFDEDDLGSGFVIDVETGKLSLQ